MMNGYLKSKCLHVAEGRVRKALNVVKPDYAEKRRNDTARLRQDI